MTDRATPSVEEASTPTPRRRSALERFREQRPGFARSRLANLLLSLDGVGVGLAGFLALTGAMEAYQGDELLLLIAGIALVSFGVMIVMRWNLRAVKTGLAGMTAAYFASALSEFEVATDPCDIGSTLERCAGHVPGGMPWGVYQGPLVLAVLFFFLIALEPYVTSARSAG